MNIIVHPECCYEVVAASDYAGSTKYIIDMIESAPSGSQWAIGTEMNLVNRIIQQHPDKEIVSLNPFMCPCLTMNRIDLPHLLWTLETIERGEEINVISVDKQVTAEAVLALNRMLECVKQRYSRCFFIHIIITRTKWAYIVLKKSLWFFMLIPLRMILKIEEVIKVKRS